MFQRVSWSELVHYKKYRVYLHETYDFSLIKKDIVFNGFVIGGTVDNVMFITGYHYCGYCIGNVADEIHTVLDVGSARIYEIKLPYLHQITGIATLAKMCWKVIEENDVDITNVEHLNIACDKV